MLHDEIERLVSIAGFDGLVARRLEDFPFERTLCRFVIDDEDAERGRGDVTEGIRGHGHDCGSRCIA
jgi:hypothetical protein